jgi:uncharacterized protein (DUF488 family)
MDKTLLSIGHSQHQVGYFIDLLKSHDVNYVLDVRSTPYSQFATSYNRENIKKILKNNGIEYAFMGEFFGARPKDSSLYSLKGYLDFEKVENSSRFKKGFDNVVKGVKQGYRIAFMCTEKDPIECHRTILVSYAFYKVGYSIEHIMPDNTIQTQQDINERLLDMYYPDRNQFSLFESENLSEEQYLVEAYKKQNEKIGYHPEEIKIGVV